MVADAWAWGGKEQEPPPPHGSHASPDSGKGLLCAARKGLFPSSFDPFCEPWPWPWRFEKQHLAAGWQPAVSESWGGGGKMRNSLFDVLYLFGWAQAPFSSPESPPKKGRSLGPRGQQGGSEWELSAICLKWGVLAGGVILVWGAWVPQYRLPPQDHRCCMPYTPICIAKAVKNSAESEGMRRAHVSKAACAEEGCVLVRRPDSLTCFVALTVVQVGMSLSLPELMREWNKYWRGRGNCLHGKPWLLVVCGPLR